MNLTLIRHWKLEILLTNDMIKWWGKRIPVTRYPLLALILISLYLSATVNTMALQFKIIQRPISLQPWYARLVHIPLRGETQIQKILDKIVNDCKEKTIRLYKSNPK